MNVMRLCVAVCVSAIVVGCGQKGPLLLPDAPKHKKVLPKTHPAATTAPSAPSPSSAPPADAPGNSPGAPPQP